MGFGQAMLARLDLRAEGMPESTETTAWCGLNVASRDGGALYLRAELSTARNAGTGAMEAVEPHPLLTLPRVWTATVQQLDFDDVEHDSYVRLRDRLAAIQGVEAEPAGGEDKAYHRLLGYPDETTGAMPGMCAELAGPADWRLLFQLTVESEKRLYVWAPDGDLRRQLVGFVR